MPKQEQKEPLKRGSGETTTTSFADRIDRYGDKRLIAFEDIYRKQGLKNFGEFYDRGADGTNTRYTPSSEVMIEGEPDYTFFGWHFYKTAFYMEGSTQAGYTVVKRKARRKRFGVLISWVHLFGIAENRTEGKQLMEAFLDRCLHEHGYDHKEDKDERFKLYKAVQQIADTLVKLLPKFQNITPQFSDPMLDTHPDIRIEEPK